MEDDGNMRGVGRLVNQALALTLWQISHERIGQESSPFTIVKTFALLTTFRQPSVLLFFRSSALPFDRFPKVSLYPRPQHSSSECFTFQTSNWTSLGPWQRWNLSELNLAFYDLSGGPRSLQQLRGEVKWLRKRLWCWERCPHAAWVAFTWLAGLPRNWQPRMGFRCLFPDFL